VVVIVGAERGPLLVEHLDVQLQRGERQGIERQGPLRVLGLAVMMVMCLST
jgi:hypothetical protein